MRALTRGMVLAVLTFGIMGVVGCGEDNESALREQAAKSSDADIKDASPPVGSMEEYAKRNPGMQGAATSSKVTKKK